MLLATIDILVSAIMLSFIYTNPLTERIRIRYRIYIGLICFCITFISIQILNISFLKIAYTYIQLILSALIIISKTKHKILNLIGMSMGYILSVTINTSFLFLLDKIFGITTYNIYSSYYSMFAFYISYFVIMFIATKLLGKLLKNFVSKEKNAPIFLIVLSVVLLCSIAILFNVTYGRTIGYSSEAIYFNCILFILLFAITTIITVMIFLSYKKGVLNEQEKVRLLDLESYVSNLENANNTYRAFKHDYINILSTLRAYIYENKNDELKEYFENHIMQTQLILDEHSDTYSELSKIKSLPLKSILISKLNTAVVKNINFLIDVNCEFEISDKYIVDISTITAIFLDNALEATEKSEHPFIGLILSDHEDCTEIIIENSLKNEDIDLLSIDDLGYSTKGNNRGTGLYNANQIIKNNPDLVVDTEIKNNIFTKTIILYKEK